MLPYAPVARVYVRRFMAIVEGYGLQVTEQEAQQFLALLESSE